MAKLPKELREKHKFGDKEIEVIYRKARPIDDPGGLGPVPPLLPSVTVENGILQERDVAVPLRDGTIIYTDIYRPEGATNLPAIIAWSPYGKRAGYIPPPPGIPTGVPPGTTSPMRKFEAPDPAYWCYHGYAVINPDPRGAGNSQGNIIFVGAQEGRDCYDFIEWVAARDWSNGKVGMSGNSWLAWIQWFAAAEKPPHLTCIAPWEGSSDLYREIACQGGIPEVGFNGFLVSAVAGPGYMEDYVAMLRKYPLMNAYWEDKIPRFDDIEIPTYVTAGWNHFHLRGSIEAFRRISSPNKWLRVHRDFEWPDYSVPENIDDLKRFFDRYLKDIRNGWEMTPRIRLDVMDAGEYDYQVWRPENEFPLARTKYQKLFLDANTGKLSYKPVPQASSVKYDAKKGLATFNMTFDKDTELTGYIKLRLWVEADGANDMDLFITIRKLDGKGNVVSTILMGEPHPGAWGKLRVSHRELDKKRSTPYRPVHTHLREQLLKPNEIVPVDIEIWPTSRIWHKGQQLSVVVSGHYIREPGWFEHFAWELRNQGKHIIYTGEKYDSHLLVPVIPPKYASDTYVYR